MVVLSGRRVRCTQKTWLVCAPDSGTFSVADLTDIASCFVAGKEASLVIGLVVDLVIGLVIGLVVGRIVVFLKGRNRCNPPDLRHPTQSFNAIIFIAAYARITWSDSSF